VDLEELLAKGKVRTLFTVSKLEAMTVEAHLKEEGRSAKS
jgi:hypothetical protein